MKFRKTLFHSTVVIGLWAILPGVLAGPNTAAAARPTCAGCLDAGFNAGIIEVEWSPDALAVQPNGWVIVSGSGFTVPGAERQGLARFRLDGTLDADFAPTVEGGTVKAIVIQPDGRLLVGGTYTTLNGVPRHGLGRLEADGTLDEDFVPPDLSPEAVDISVLALQSDGKVLVGGGAEGTNFQLLRLHPDGRVDESFQVTNALAVSLVFILPQADGRLLVGGCGGIAGETPDSAGPVTRLNADGSLDSSFTPPPLGGMAVRAAALQPDGKLLLGFEREYPPSAFHSKPRFGTVIRLNADGSSDAGFASGLITETDARPAEWVGLMVSALAVQPDGRILVGGGFDFVNQVRRAGVARLEPDGALDRSFETDIAYHPARDRVEAVSTLALAPDAKLVIGGYLNEINGRVHHGLARLHLADDACAGVIALTTNLHVVRENAGQLALTVTRRGSLAHTVMVGYATADSAATGIGAARQGHDYLARSGTLEFRPGESAKVVSIPILDNWVREANREFHLTLSAPTGAALLGYPGSDWLGTRVLILDNENAGQPGNVSEGFTSPFWFGQPAVFRGVEQLQVQPDGKLLIAGGFTRAACEQCSGLKRLLPDGAWDEDFQPEVGGEVWAMLLLSNGKIVIGGDFISINGTPRTNLARLNSDGSLDGDYRPTVAGPVRRLARRADGLFVSCEVRADLPETFRIVRRFDGDGTEDAGFSPATVAGVAVLAMELQPDGKVLVGGSFGSVNATPRHGLARLHVNGSLDEGFQPVLVQESVVIEDLALQPDGRVLVGGSFTALGGISRCDIARLNGDGSLDPSFDTRTQTRRQIYALALQPDGKVVVGGLFGHDSGTPLNLVRLQADGSPDPGFWPGSGATTWIGVRALALLANGDLFIGGGFECINGLPQRFIARLHGGVTRPVWQPPVRLANGDVRLTVMGWETNRPYAVEVSTNLLDWVAWEAAGPGSNVLHFLDTSSANRSQRFFRTRQ